MFLKENSFLLIDEPTDHLDMHARELVSRYLASKNGFILVSHDRAFLDDCIDHVLYLSKFDIVAKMAIIHPGTKTSEIRMDFSLHKAES